MLLYRVKKLFIQLVPFPSYRRAWRKRLECDKIYIPEAWFVEDVVKKRRGFDKVKDTLDTLAVGSSHADCGFNPACYGVPAYNLGSSSQDLYTSYKIYELHGNLPHLKTVILFYSVFSAGFNLFKCSERLRGVAHKEFFDVPYPERHFWGGWEKRLRAMGSSVQVEEGFNGFTSPHSFIGADYPLKLRVNGHLKHNLRQPKELQWLQKMGALCKKRGHRLVLVIAPARQDYRAALPNEEKLFATLYGCALDPNSVLNYYSDPDFSYEDFGDTDHLNFAGACKLTLKIKEKL